MKSGRGFAVTSCRLLACILLLQVVLSSELTNEIPDPYAETNDTHKSENADLPGVSVEQNDHRTDDVIKPVVEFLLSKRDSATYGWGPETHRALTVLAISGAIPPNDQQDPEQKLMIKELELRTAIALAKHHQEEVSAGQLALYVNALIAVCHNPRDFYGLNLVSKLYHKNEQQLSYPYSLQSLALCNAGAAYSKNRTLQLIEYIKVDPSEHGGFIDNFAMTTLALSCGQKYHPEPPIDRYLSRAVKTLKRAQKEDGSFGNIYSSALGVQALLFAEASDKNWNRSLAMEYILSQQKEDGSFQDFMGTFFALPLLKNLTLGSLANWNCDNVESTSDKNGDSDVTTTPESRTVIDITVFVRAPEMQTYQVGLTGYTNDSLYTILTTNEESISMEFKDTAYGHMIISVDGLNQDPRNNKYWLIYVVDKDGRESSATKGVDGIFPEDGSSFVFELKTFNS